MEGRWVLTYPGRISAQAIERIQATLPEALASGKPMVLEDGMRLSRVGDRPFVVSAASRWGFVPRLGLAYDWAYVSAALGILSFGVGFLVGTGIGG